VLQHFAEPTYHTLMDPLSRDPFNAGDHGLNILTTRLLCHVANPNMMCRGFALQNQRGRGMMSFIFNSITSAKRVLNELDKSITTTLPFLWVNKEQYETTGEQSVLQMMKDYNPDTSVVVQIAVLIGNGRELNPSSPNNDTWYKELIVSVEECTPIMRVKTREIQGIQVVQQMGHICTHCASIVLSNKKPVCGRCKDAKYCNRDCQKQDWVRHKHECTEVADLKARRYQLTN
jgi:hypothetical protein